MEPPADVAQDLTQGFFMELLERELLEKFDAKKKPAANLPARLRGQFCFELKTSRTAAEARRKCTPRRARFYGCGRGAWRDS